jgi:hypothetical protein
MLVLSLRRLLTILISMPARKVSVAGYGGGCGGLAREWIVGVVPVEVILVAAELKAETLGVIRRTVGAAEHEVLAFETFAGEKPFPRFA